MISLFNYKNPFCYAAIIIANYFSLKVQPQNLANTQRHSNEQIAKGKYFQHQTYHSTDVACFLMNFPV